MRETLGFIPSTTKNKSTSVTAKPEVWTEWGMMAMVREFLFCVKKYRKNDCGDV
jgi:hypothetical protein